MLWVKLVKDLDVMLAFDYGEIEGMCVLGFMVVCGCDFVIFGFMFIFRLVKLSYSREK